MDWEAWLKERVALAESAAAEAEAKAKSAVAKADAEARVAEAEALEAEAKAQVAEAEAEAKARAAEAEALEAEAKAQVAVAEAEAKARAAEAEAAIKIRVAEAEAREADLKIVKLRKELEVLTGVPLDSGDEEQNSGTVLLEDLEFNEPEHSSPRSSQFRQDGLKRKRLEEELTVMYEIALHKKQSGIKESSGLEAAVKVKEKVEDGSERAKVVAENEGLPSSSFRQSRRSPTDEEAPVYCPVTTTSRTRPFTVNDESIELRAYKLGKGKCSYNMVKLDFLHELTPQTKSLSVVEATETRAGAEDGPAGGIEESMLSYELTLNNKSKVLLNVYVVYSVPTEEVAEDGKPVYTWKLVKRGYCKRGCKGPILKAIQRFGKLGRRCSEIWSSTNYNTKQLQQAANSKDQRFLFISIDEACTHVAMGDKKTRFRLLFSVDDASTGERIGSAVSAPIRVLANNDAPNGAAYINMPVPLPSSSFRQSWTRKVWSEQEDLAFVEAHKALGDNWGAIAERRPGRDYHSIYYRWNRILSLKSKSVLKDYRQRVEVERAKEKKDVVQN